ncbi:hypothetical protein BT93_F0685 [Corymbia citriodora subsp. variegata]|nr:hypothetical protein BT93_F0685 [Corymbia citriodora subsp. variegata]
MRHLFSFSLSLKRRNLGTPRTHFLSSGNPNFPTCARAVGSVLQILVVRPDREVQVGRC